MKNYYLHDGNVQSGPYTLEELRAKKIKPETMAWYEGVPGWTPAYLLEDLKILFETPSVPIPPPFSVKKSKSQTRSWLWALVIIVIGAGVYFGYQVITQKKEIEQVKGVNKDLTEESEKQKRKENEDKQRDAAISSKKKKYRNNWQNYIGTGNTQYEFSALGGVEPFEIPIVNNTDYLLEEVRISVDYIKTAGGIYKTEEIVVYNIPALSTKSGTTTYSPRGTSVKVSITGIVSKEMQFCYPEGSWVEGDPYLCK